MLSPRTFKKADAYPGQYTPKKQLLKAMTEGYFELDDDQVELNICQSETKEYYKVELTDDDETAIADAASQFMAANSEETIKELAVTEDQVKTLLELQTIQKKMYDPVVAEGKITVSDDEANQTTFTYVSISTSGDDITDEEKKTKKEQT